MSTQDPNYDDREDDRIEEMYNRKSERHNEDRDNKDFDLLTEAELRRIEAQEIIDENQGLL